MTEQLKKISIRGRFAFCLACLRNAMRQERIDAESLSLMLERLGTFMSTNKLDEWEKNVVEISPDTLFDNHPDNNFEDYETISSTDLVQLKSAYEKLPLSIIKLIDLTISVGLSNLYGGTSEYSLHSLTPTLEVIALMDSSGYELPSLEEFAHYSFADNNGWGFAQE